MKNLLLSFIRPLWERSPFTLGLTLVLLFSSQVLASHIHGGDITYKCLGNGVYEITVRYYEQCNWPHEDELDLYVLNLDNGNCLNQSSGGTSCQVTAELPLVASYDALTESDPSIFCNTNTSCEIKELIYRGNITLSNNTNGYRIAVWFRGTELRAFSNNIEASTRPVLSADIVNVSACDQSATFDRHSRWKVCMGAENCVDASVTEPDGDDVVYTIVATKEFSYTSSGGFTIPSVTYVNNYSLSDLMGTNPNLTVNSDGQICFTPTTLGSFFVTVEAESFRNQASMGKVSKDIYIDVVNCPANSGHNLEACFTLGNEFCENEPIIADGSCSENEERHHWYVEEVDENFNRTFQNMWETTLFSTASTYDLKAGYAQGGFGFEAGKCYRIALGVSRLCGTQFAWEGTVKNICIKEAPSELAGLDRYICLGESTVLGEVPPMEDPNIYQWSTGATDAQITVSPTVGTSYLLTITGPNGCQTVDEVSVMVDAMAPEQPTIHAADVCQGVESCMNVTYNGVATQGGGTYIPYPNEVTYTFSDGSVYVRSANQIHDPVCRAFSTPGTKTVTVTIENACGTATASTTFEVFPSPSVSITNTATDLCNTSFSLTTQVTSGTQPFSYEWSSVSDHGTYTNTANNIGTGSSITASASTPYGITTYSVTVTDANGCTAVEEIVVDYTICCCLNWPGFTYDNIPNVFTPNGDGINDTWLVPDDNNPVYCTHHAQKFSLHIFNRWGAIVFEKEKEGVLVNGDIQWNGKVDGTGPMVPDGTYDFVLTFIGCGDTETMTVTGTISIIGSGGKRLIEFDKPDEPINDEEMLHPADVKLFPNPSTDVFELQVSRVLENTQLIVTDYMGREVHRQPMAAGNNVTQSVDATAWSSGVYLYRLVQDNGYVAYRGRMVKAQP